MATPVVGEGSGRPDSALEKPTPEGEVVSPQPTAFSGNRGGGAWPGITG